ncbi:MAG TPA: hypothetical protein VHE78_11640 [Gemmatimonadaceae bacterium]|nr:hypothetical protein [Gemmatimonadaceae bacterium]
MKHSRLIVAAWAVGAIVACDRAASARARGADSTAAGASLAAADAGASGGGNDPCTLVTRAEAEKYLGPLAHDPFRVNEQGEPVPDGSKCEYRATDGRHIYIEPTWTDGKVAMKVVGLGGQIAGRIFTENNGKTDTLEGTWDESRWLGPGTFFAVKGDAMVVVDVNAARGGIAAAADLASKGLGRMGSPLRYDGAKASASAPRPRETGDACALVTQAEVEAIVGPLMGAPAPQGQGSTTECTYKTRANGAELRLAVTWRDGFQQFAENKMATGTVRQQFSGLTGARGKTGAGNGNVKGEAIKNSPPVDADAQKLMGALRGLAKSQGVEMDSNLAPAHDTAVAGPWAEGAVLLGSTFEAVKNDVLVSVDFHAVSLEKAKALVAKAVGRL